MKESTGELPRLGVKIPNHGGPSTHPGVVTMARIAEDAGADALHVSDHVVLREPKRSRYPFTPDGSFPWAVDTDVLDALVCCATIAAVTTRVSVGPSVLVLPQRHPLEVAKAAASIDRISGERLFLGVGAGWLAEEFDALGQDFATRIPRMREGVEVMRHAWSGDTGAFHGEFYDVPAGTYCRPLPERPSGIPVLVGGMTPAALRRAARFGDGWIALTIVGPGAPVDLHEPELERLRSHRPSSGFHTVMRVICGEAESSRLPEIVADLARVGYDEVSIDVPWSEPEKAEAIIAACREALRGPHTPQAPRTSPRGSGLTV
ncbi:putative F420-dependent oxidoreductase [Streptomyces griseochromogenes]|uniref:F420-dependent oxidoreductase n=2 Tax=Streptomyces griseochromogenes TaxID=68214 RepID=A0ABS4MAJ4_9ACTN|nr:TIGR03619 family F420-dependent LLM class oxidoreductase [Streptomyces griseochromogenes]MBP2056684.1 putative F420-dependent oxidoreductase [Streptomyces griseochromogenes]